MCGDIALKFDIYQKVMGPMIHGNTCKFEIAVSCPSVILNQLSSASHVHDKRYMKNVPSFTGCQNFDRSTSVEG